MMDSPHLTFPKAEKTFIYEEFLILTEDVTEAGFLQY
jgi:hypothetical protein